MGFSEIGMDKMREETRKRIATVEVANWSVNFATDEIRRIRRIRRIRSIGKAANGAIE